MILLLSLFLNLAIAGELSPGEAAMPMKLVGSDSDGAFTFWVDATSGGRLKVDTSGSSTGRSWVLDFLSDSVTAIGPVTDAQLRASPVPVSGPLTDTQLRSTPVPVSGPLTDVQLRASAIVVNGSGVTQPISAVALPLPTGASTAANQATANASLSSIDTKLTAPLSVTGPLTDTQLRASPVPISVASLPLPAGAATEATLASFASVNHSDLNNLYVSATSLYSLTSNFAATNDTHLSNLETSLSGFRTDNHADLLTLHGDVTTANANLLAFKSANHTDLAQINTTLGTPMQNSGGSVQANAGTNLNTSALNLEATQSSFKSATHTDLVQIDTDILAFKSANHTDLGLVSTAANQSTLNTRVGDVTETAPASDTASSGLNGRLQRIAQRITSLIALLPSSIGQKTMSDSLSVAIASDQSSIPVAATIVSGGTINVVPVGTLKTYSAAIQSLGVAATATDIVTITGSATKTVKVSRVLVSGTQTNSGQVHFYLVKRSTADSGGTSATVTGISHDSSDAAATAVVKSYTANPTLGTTVGTIRAFTLLIPSSNAASSTGSISALELAQAPQKNIVLNGTSEQLVVNLGGVSMAGSALDIVVEWTEE